MNLTNLFGRLFSTISPNYFFVFCIGPILQKIGGHVESSNHLILSQKSEKYQSFVLLAPK